MGSAVKERIFRLLPADKSGEPCNEGGRDDLRLFEEVDGALVLAADEVAGENDNAFRKGARALAFKPGVLVNCTLYTAGLIEECQTIASDMGIDAIKKLKFWYDEAKWKALENVSFRYDGSGQMTITAPEKSFLSYSFLCGADFRKLVAVDLVHDRGGGESEVVRSESDLRNANFLCAYALHSNFSGLGMKGANFQGGTLHGASLVGTECTEMDLSYTNLYDAELQGAVFWKATLANARWVDRAKFTPHEANLFGAPDRLVQARSFFGSGEDGQAPGRVVADDPSSDDVDGYGAIDLPAWSRKRASLVWNAKDSDLSIHYDELEYLAVELDRLRQIEISSTNWDEYFDAWAALDGMYHKFSNPLAKAIIEVLFSERPITRDPSSEDRKRKMKPRLAMGAANALYHVTGQPPKGLLTLLKEHVGRILRTPEYFDVIRRIRKEMGRIERVQLAKKEAQVVVQNGILALGIGVTTFIQNLILEAMYDRN